MASGTSSSLKTSFSSLSLSEQPSAMDIDEKSVTVKKTPNLDKILQAYQKALQEYNRTGDSKVACQEYAISETTFLYGLSKSRLPNAPGNDETKFLAACDKNIRFSRAVKK